MMAAVMKPTLIQNMLNKLRCHFCLSRVEIPLIQCIRGHYYCMKCIQISSNCFECQIPIGPGRDHLFENLCFSIKLKCSFSVNGCNITGTAIVIVEHEKYCHFSSEPHSMNSDTMNNSMECFMNTQQHQELEQKTKSNNAKAGQSLEELLAELECPVCMKHITTSICQCENGHRICSRCFNLVDRCPVCRGQQSLSKNELLESFFFMMEVHCNYAERGCVFRSKGSIVRKHEESCKYGIESCPLTNYRACTWKGTKSEIIGHCQTDHSEVFSSGSSHEWDIGGFLMDGCCQSVVKLVFTHNDIFLNCWEKSADEIIFSVRYLGNENMLLYSCVMRILPLCCDSEKATQMKIKLNEIIKIDVGDAKLPLELLMKIHQEGFRLMYGLEILKY